MNIFKKTRVRTSARVALRIWKLAEVDRDAFRVIAIFDHDVFDQNSAERKRLWALHESIIFRGVPPDSAVVMGNIATSGHSVHVVRYAQRCARTIRDFEPKLDDLNYMGSLYRQGQQMPPEPKFAWGFRHLACRAEEVCSCVPTTNTGHGQWWPNGATIAQDRQRPQTAKKKAPAGTGRGEVNTRPKEHQGQAPTQRQTSLWRKCETVPRPAIFRQRPARVKKKRPRTSIRG
jgi:hypothetical protein